MRKANELRNFSVHKVHYSQNSKPLIFKSNPIIANFPALSHVKVDEHWVWTPGYGDYLKELGHGGPVHVVGPITFYSPGIAPDISDREIRIAVFDITPIPDDVAKKYGIMSIYYSTDTLLRFIDDIHQSCCELESKTGRRIQILLKFKRETTKGVHDDRYIDYVSDMVDTHRGVDLVPNDVNVYDFLSSCDLSISIPYTTAAYVSNHLGQDAIYYDPTMELLPSYECTPLIGFASGRPELVRLIENSLSASSFSV
jgi:polysaccharide biosynthesis PFTS motif protein